MRLFTVPVAAITAALLCAGSAVADNYVTVESKTVRVGATDQTVGIYMANDVYLSAVGLPLELRSVSGGAYCDGPFRFRALDYPWSAGLDDFATLLYYSTPASTNDCSGPTSASWTGGAGSPNADGSPDAVYFGGLVTISAYFPPGADPPGQPSFEITFDANTSAGEFEIDTCCILPYSHVMFVDDVVNPVVPSFTKGTITIACECDCLGDWPCDGEYDILDVIAVIEVAFRESAAVVDPLCPVALTDLDCDGDTDILDVVRIANVAFRDADPATMFCDPCGL